MSNLSQFLSRGIKKVQRESTGSSAESITVDFVSSYGLQAVDMAKSFLSCSGWGYATKDSDGQIFGIQPSVRLISATELNITYKAPYATGMTYNGAICYWEIIEFY